MVILGRCAALNRLKIVMVASGQVGQVAACRVNDAPRYLRCLGEFLP